MSDGFHIEGKCEHYNGTAKNKLCDAGVAYDSVADLSQRPTRYPCYTLPSSAECKTTCEKRLLPTKEQIAATDQMIEAHFKKFNDDIAAKTCPVCSVKWDSVEQVGHCVYAKPCGHRLGQGNVRNFR